MSCSAHLWRFSPYFTSTSDENVGSRRDCLPATTEKGQLAPPCSWDAITAVSPTEGRCALARSARPGGLAREWADQRLGAQDAMARRKARDAPNAFVCYDEGQHRGIMPPPLRQFLHTSACRRTHGKQRWPKCYLDLPDSASAGAGVLSRLGTFEGQKGSLRLCVRGVSYESKKVLDT